MLEPLHRTADNEFPGPNEAGEWRVSALAPTDDHSARFCSYTGMLRPGMTVKIIYHDAIRHDDRLACMAREFSSAGALIRTTSAWMPSMVINNRQRATLVAGSTDLWTGTTTIEEPVIIAILTAIFDQAWNAAIPLASSRPPESRAGARELREVERNLLSLLAAGVTDGAAARQLGLSLRTTRRRIAALMSHLAASSRFQAGAEAARRGWLT